MTRHYRIRILPAVHEVEVELVLDGLIPDRPVRLSTPTWVPGAYGFMKYGRDLFDVRARDPASSADVPLIRDGWSGWIVQPRGDRLVVTFRAYAFDQAWGELVGLVGHDQAVLLGTHLLFPDGEDGPCRVRYELPPGWAMHHPTGARRLGDAEFEYPDHRALLDAPVVAGAHEVVRREVEGVPFDAVFLDRAAGFDTEAARFADDLAKIALACRAVFGSFPFEGFSFVFTFNPLAKWGLEHPTSTMIALGADCFVDPAVRARGLRVCAHELFHAWNVCRLMPAPLGAADFTRGSFPDGLWLSEGATRYYEFLLCVRAGLLAPEAFLSNVVNFYRTLSALPAYRRASPLDSSRATFLSHNRYPGSVNNTIDYYDAGMLVAFDLDAHLRLAERPTSLDRELARFYEAHAGRGAGFTHARAREFFGGSAPGAGELLEREVERPGGLSVPRQLERLGFEVRMEEAFKLGLVLKENAGPTIVDVLDDSPAGGAGLAPDDVIARVDGFPFSLKALEWLVARGRALELEVARGHRALRFTVEPRREERIGALAWRGSPDQAQRLSDWLGRPDLELAAGREIPLTSHENFHGIQAVV